MAHPASFAEFVEAGDMIVAALVATLDKTEFGKYYPDADVVVRFRHGKVLPVVEINLKREVRGTRQQSMQKG